MANDVMERLGAWVRTHKAIAIGGGVVVGGGLFYVLYKRTAASSSASPSAGNPVSGSAGSFSGQSPSLFGSPFPQGGGGGGGVPTGSSLLQDVTPGFGSTRPRTPAFPSSITVKVTGLPSANPSATPSTSAAPSSPSASPTPAPKPQPSPTTKSQAQVQVPTYAQDVQTVASTPALSRPITSALQTGSGSSVDQAVASLGDFQAGAPASFKNDGASTHTTFTPFSGPGAWGAAKAVLDSGQPLYTSTGQKVTAADIKAGRVPKGTVLGVKQTV